MAKDFLHTSIGIIEIVATTNGVKQIRYREDEPTEKYPTDITNECKKQLEEYFEGKRQEFELKLLPDGTDFQRMVWAELQRIAFSKTTTYGDLSRALSRGDAIRAIAGAIGKNPIAVVIPCHRVLGKGGKLTGYAGGLWRKKKLLEIESGNNGFFQ